MMCGSELSWLRLELLMLALSAVGLKETVKLDKLIGWSACSAIVAFVA
jgi:hypothetical protein